MWRRSAFGATNRFPATQRTGYGWLEYIRTELVEYFAQRYASKAGKSIRTIERRIRERLLASDWPGDIRELESVVESSVI
jgi:hypothetical protein